MKSMYNDMMVGVMFFDLDVVFVKGMIVYY